MRRSKHGAVLGERGRVHLLGQAEIQKPDRAFFIGMPEHKDIRGLDIAVQNTPLMSDAQGAGDGAEQFDGMRRRNLFSARLKGF